MKKETKEEVQIYTAVGMLMSGVGLSVAGFIVEPTGQIHESVLWFFAHEFISSLLEAHFLLLSQPQATPAREPSR